MTGYTCTSVSLPDTISMQVRPQQLEPTPYASSYGQTPIQGSSPTPDLDGFHQPQVHSKTRGKKQTHEMFNSEVGMASVSSVKNKKKDYMANEEKLVLSKQKRNHSVSINLLPVVQSSSDEHEFGTLIQFDNTELSSTHFSSITNTNTHDTLQKVPPPKSPALIYQHTEDALLTSSQQIRGSDVLSSLVSSQQIHGSDVLSSLGSIQPEQSQNVSRLCIHSDSDRACQDSESAKEVPPYIYSPIGCVDSIERVETPGWREYHFLSPNEEDDNTEGMDTQQSIYESNAPEDSQHHIQSNSTRPELQDRSTTLNTPAAPSFLHGVPENHCARCAFQSSTGSTQTEEKVLKKVKILQQIHESQRQTLVELMANQRMQIEVKLLAQQRLATQLQHDLRNQEQRQPETAEMIQQILATQQTIATLTQVLPELFMKEQQSLKELFAQQSQEIMQLI